MQPCFFQKIPQTKPAPVSRMSITSHLNVIRQLPAILLADVCGQPFKFRPFFEIEG